MPHSIDESCHPHRMQIVCLSEVLKIHHILTFFLCHQTFFSTFLRLFCFIQNEHVLFDNSHDTSCCCVPCLRAMVIRIIIIIIIIIKMQVQRPRTRNTENVAYENSSDPCGCWCAWYSEEGYGLSLIHI